MIYFISTEERSFADVDMSTGTLEECLQYCQNLEEIGVDTETTGFDPHTCDILTLQLGDFYNQYVIDVKHIDISHFKAILETKTLLMQNAKFDLRFFYKHDIWPKKLYDTFLTELVLKTGTERSQLHVALDDIAWKYCNVKLDKTIRGNINREGLSDRVIRYAADDVKWLHKIKDKQLEQVYVWKLGPIVNLENEVTKVFAKMEYDGILLDTEKWKEIAELTTNEYHNLEKKLDSIIDKDPIFKSFKPIGIQQNLFGFEERISNINWSSSQQKQELLKVLGIIEDSTGDRILQRNKHKHELISTLIEYNKHKKLSDAFGLKFLSEINKKTKRIHMDIWPVLSTGRIAVSNPNLNQIPSKGELGKQIRSCFIPKEGYKIVGGDYSGMELRIIAEFSQDPVWINAFKEDKDLHGELAALTFDINIDNVKDVFPPKPDLKYRDVQKTVNFGLAYGMSHFKLADTIQVPEEEAKSIINRFFSAVPKVKEFLQTLGELGKKRGYIRTGEIYSRVRWFPQWHAAQDTKNKDRFKILGEIERASMNSPIQGTNANIIKLALINVQKEIDKNNWPVTILLSVYDEIQTECKEDRAEEWAKKLEEIMIDSAKEFIKTVPIKADCGVSDCWSK